MRDPGLQPQRTALAWQRTGLAMFATVGATGFVAIRIGAPVLAACAFSVAVVVGYLAVRHFPKGADRVPSRDAVWPTLVRTVVLTSAAAFIGAALGVEAVIGPP